MTMFWGVDATFVFCNFLRVSAFFFFSLYLLVIIRSALQGSGGHR